MNLAVLDLETNGFQGTSVLSVSAVVFDQARRVLDASDRYDFPEEEFSPGALGVNGLYPERIAFLRKAGASCLWCRRISAWSGSGRR